MLNDPMRHVLAGLAALACFAALAAGLSVHLLVSAVAGAAAYGGVRLVTAPARRAAPSAPVEKMLTPDVSEADLARAVGALRDAAKRLEALEPRAPVEVGDAIAEMAARLYRIADLHERDPRDVKHTRVFIRHDLERMVETCERFVDLAVRTDPTDGRRLWPISERIRGFAPSLAKIEEACLENDFMRLEVEAEVLGTQIGR